MHLGRTTAGAGPQVDVPGAERTKKLDLIERLADDLAHEIKNPLHSMVINLEVLKRRVSRPGGSPPEELLRYVGVLTGELDRVNRRVELLLRLIRPDRGGGEATTLEEALGEILELLELEQKRRKVSVHYEPSSIPVRDHLPLDPARQLVAGLLFDTVEMVPSGGALTIRTEVDPPWSRLKVEAVGPESGAAVDLLALHDELVARLAVVRNLTDRLGGQLEVSPGSASQQPGERDLLGSITLSLPLIVSTS